MEQILNRNLILSIRDWKTNIESLLYVNYKELNKSWQRTVEVVTNNSQFFLLNTFVVVLYSYNVSEMFSLLIDEDEKNRSFRRLYYFFVLNGER